jgi:hypothetical protein
VAEPLELFRLKCVIDRRTTAINLTHFKRNNPWSVGSPPDTTTVQQDRSRFTSHEGEFTSRNSSSTFNLQSYIHYYKPSSKISKLIQKPCLTDKHNSLSNSQRKKKFYATTFVAKANTKLSPGPGVTPEGQSRPGMGPTPRTSQKERTLATQGCPWDSRRLYLKTDIGKAEYSNTQQDLPGAGYT